MNNNNLQQKDATEEEPVNMLALAKQAYDLRMLRVGDDEDENMEAARKRARELCDVQSKAEAAAMDAEVRRIGNLEGDAKAVMMGALAAIKCTELQAKLTLELDDHKYMKLKEEGKTMTRLVRDRLLPEAEQCPNERADGTPCGRPITKKQLICTACRSGQMRKPSKLSHEEWDNEKKRREAVRSKQAQDRYKRNKVLLDRLSESKKNKKRGRNEPGMLQQIVINAAAESHRMVPSAPAKTTLPTTSAMCNSDCGEMLRKGHIHTCETCNAQTCDIYECINSHVCMFDE
jgi:hypothetical protein